MSDIKDKCRYISEATLFELAIFFFRSNFVFYQGVMFMSINKQNLNALQDHEYVDSTGFDDQISLSWSTNTTLTTAMGNDTVQIDNGNINTVVQTGAGNDSIYNQGSNSSIDAGVGNDTIFNDNYASINGGDGDDYIRNISRLVTTFIVTTRPGNVPIPASMPVSIISLQGISCSPPSTAMQSMSASARPKTSTSWTSSCPSASKDCYIHKGSLHCGGFFFCRDDSTRTSDPYVPNVVRYQLRYIPKERRGSFTAPS